MCLHEYFQENCRYVSDCFRRLKYTYWAASHPNIMTPRPIQQKGPTFLGNCCPFSHFLTHFLPLQVSISIFSQHLLTRILENLFHALKVTQSKYHLIWTPRSKKIQFQSSLFRGAYL